MPKCHIWIWPDAPDRDPPVRLFDGSAADWLRWGSQGRTDGDKMDVADDETAEDATAYAEGRVFISEL